MIGLCSSNRRSATIAALIVALMMAPAAGAAPLQSKYHLPAACFAYVGDIKLPATWKLPYRHADGSVDRHRLPLAIEAALASYRGRRARIPEAALPEVLGRLGRAAQEIGKLPPGAAHPAPIYRRLAAALQQLGARKPSLPPF
jgi:hypothetical protein